MARQASGQAAAPTMINTSGPAQEEEKRIDRQTVVETAMRYLENLEQSDIMIQDPAEKK